MNWALLKKRFHNVQVLLASGAKENTLSDMEKALLDAEPPAYPGYSPAFSESHQETSDDEQDVTTPSSNSQKKSRCVLL